MREKTDTNPLVCVITGMEWSGTTLLSQLLNAHPCIASGFELGFLLSDIRDFNRVRPFYDRLTESWGVIPADRDRLLRAASFEEMYALLNTVKGRAYADPHLRDLFRDSPWIYDKTPGYIYELTAVMRKTDRPFVVTLKTPLEAVASFKRKRGRSIAARFAEGSYALAFAGLRRAVRRRLRAVQGRPAAPLAAFLRDRYARALTELRQALDREPARVLVVQYKSLAGDPLQTMDRVKGFVGIHDDAVLSLEQYNRRFGPYRTGISSTFQSNAIEYATPCPDLSEAEQAELDEFTRQYGPTLDLIQGLAV